MKKCTCLKKPLGTSQDYNMKWIAWRNCPLHATVKNKHLIPYEDPASDRHPATKATKAMKYNYGWTVLQAVHLGKDKGQTGVKAFDTSQGYRCTSIFPTKDDARLYLLEVLKTIRLEQIAGVRSKNNLDPDWNGGLDFLIAPVVIGYRTAPLKKRGWKISTKKP